MDRYAIEPNTLSLIKHFEKGGMVPPIKLAKLRCGQYKILDGRHRVTASKLMGKSNILAKYSEKYFKEI